MSPLRQTRASAAKAVPPPASKSARPRRTAPPMYDFGVLRELRKQAGLTLDETGSRAGVSLAVISKLERNQTSAELETLHRLGNVFGLTAANLLGLAESRNAHKIQSSSYQSSGFTFRKIAYGNVAAFLADAPAGARLSKPEMHSDEFEICWVLRGAIELTLPFGTSLLAAGEAV